MNNKPYVLGDFIWTAFDYIGESAIGSNGLYTPKDITACNNTYCTVPWKYHLSYCGDFDITGFTKPQNLFRRVLWGLGNIFLLN